MLYPFVSSDAAGFAPDLYTTSGLDDIFSPLPAFSISSCVTVISNVLPLPLPLLTTADGCGAASLSAKVVSENDCPTVINAISNANAFLPIVPSPFHIIVYSTVCKSPYFLMRSYVIKSLFI